MLNKEKLNRNIVAAIYGSMLIIVLVFLISFLPPFGLLIYISVLLQALIIILIPIAIIYCGYKMIKETSKMNILYFVLSVLSLTWFLLLFLAIASVLEKF